MQLKQFVGPLVIVLAAVAFILFYTRPAHEPTAQNAAPAASSTPMIVQNQQRDAGNSAGLVHPK